MDNIHTLLFVDDEHNILTALRRLFHREGYQILLANSGKEGLELLAKNEVSLIISDQRMPEMIGAEFLARSQEISPHSMRIMLTGYSDIEAAIQAINEGGIYRYITKPWDDEDIKLVVREALQRLDLEQENRQLTEELKTKNAALEDFNAKLEKKVSERTQELHLKVKELEGKDRIAQHMLEVHTLEETLELVLVVITEILELDKGIVYLKDEQGINPKAAIGVAAPGLILPQDDLAALTTSPVQQRAFEIVEEGNAPVNITDPQGHPIPPFAVVPILRGEDLLGYIESDNHRSNQPIANEEMETLASFALQAAVAISEAQSQRDYSSWKNELDNVLKDVDGLDSLAGESNG